MRIKELSEKYNVDKRTIDYYTREGLLPYEPENLINNYRQYYEESERILKRILILREIGYSISEVKEMLYSGESFSNERLEYCKAQLIKRREEEISRIDKLIGYTYDI